VKISDKTIERALSSGIRLSQVGDNIIISAKAGTDDAYALYKCSGRGAYLEDTNKVGQEDFCYMMRCEEDILNNLDGFGHIFRSHYESRDITHATAYSVIYIDDYGQVAVRWDVAPTVGEAKKHSRQFNIPGNKYKHKGSWVITSRGDKVEAHFRDGRRRWADPIFGMVGTSAAMAWMQKAGAPGDTMREIARAYHGCW